MKKHIIVTVGVSASGKTTWAQEFVYSQLEQYKQWVIISRDDIRVRILKEKFPDEEFSWGKWKWKWEKEVTEYQHIEIDVARSDDKLYGIIIADTNLNFDRLSQMVKNFTELGDDVEIKEFPIEFEEAVKRDNARKNGVGYSVIADQTAKWHQYHHAKNGSVPWKPNNKLPVAVMVDIDGTLAHAAGKRGIFEWAKVGVDDLDPMVAEVIRGLSERGFDIIIMSGRDGSCRKETEQWLDDHDVPSTHLFMRLPGDMRKDSIIKAELFWQHVAPFYNVMGVFDDRPQVVRKWQEIGLKTFALGNQLIEF